MLYMNYATLIIVDTSYAYNLQGGDWPKSRNHVRITTRCSLFIGKKNYRNFGSTIVYLN